MAIATRIACITSQHLITSLQNTHRRFNLLTPKFLPIRPIHACRSRFIVAQATQAPHPQLSSGERKIKRAEAQRLGKALVTVHLGQKGVTLAFLQGLADAISKNELVKVRIPGGDLDMEEKELIDLIETSLSCVLVHKIGFTLTFFRDKGLPAIGKLGDIKIPSPISKDDGDDGDDDDYVDIFEGQESDDEEEKEEEEVLGKKKSKKKGANLRNSIKVVKSGPPPPPEFTVLKP